MRPSGTDRTIQRTAYTPGIPSTNAMNGLSIIAQNIVISRDYHAI